MGNFSPLLVLIALIAVVNVNGQTSTTRMKQNLVSHFSQARHHVTNPGYKMAARNFISQQFSSMGLTTVNQAFDTALAQVKGVNVIGILKGKNYNTTSDSIIAISAHYDTMRNTSGVNDNGAGVVIMLEAARELSQSTSRDSTLLFIAFDMEEWERYADAACTQQTTLCGSKSLVSDWLPTFFSHWPLTWRAMANMDTVLNFNEIDNSQSWPMGLGQLFPDQVASVQSDQSEGDFLTVAGRTPQDMDSLRSFNQSWYQQGEPKFEIETFPLNSVALNLATDFTRSDHARFWEANLTCLFLTDTADLRGYMQTCYHESCDNITYATDERMQFAAKIASSLVSWVDTMSPGEKGTGDSSVLSGNHLMSFLMACVVIMTSLVL